MENIKISEQLKELFDAYDEKCLESNSQQLIHNQFDIQCILANDYSNWQCDNPWHVADSLVFRQLLSDVICSKCCYILTNNDSIEIFPKEYGEWLKI